MQTEIEQKKLMSLRQMNMLNLQNSQLRNCEINLECHGNGGLICKQKLICGEVGCGKQMCAACKADSNQNGKSGCRVLCCRK